MRYAPVAIVFLALACERPPEQNFWSGGWCFTSNPLNTRTAVIYDLVPDRDVELEFTTTRCQESCDNPGLGGTYDEFYRKTGMCVRAGQSSPPAEPLNVADAAVDVWYKCGAVETSRTRLSFELVAPSRMQADHRGRTTECLGSSEPAELRMEFQQLNNQINIQFHVQGTYWDP